MQSCYQKYRRLHSVFKKKLSTGGSFRQDKTNKSILSQNTLNSLNSMFVEVQNSKRT